jgi:hypothetical protein
MRLLGSCSLNCPAFIIVVFVLVAQTRITQTEDTMNPLIQKLCFVTIFSASVGLPLNSKWCSTSGCNLLPLLPSLQVAH